MKIAHITTDHARTDARIFVKELATIREALGLDCILIVQDGVPDEEAGGVRIMSAGPKLRRQRHTILIGIWRILFKVLAEKPGVVHFHNAELLPVGLIIRAMGKKVIYDVHEDVPKQLLHSPTVPRFVARIVGQIYLGFEWVARRVLSACIVVVPDMLSRFRGERVMLLPNFPKLAEFPNPAEFSRVREGSGERATGRFIYVGGISRARGIHEMVEAMALVGDARARLHVLGTFISPQLETEVRAHRGWHRVQFLGWSSRRVVVDELSRAAAGLVLLHVTPQYVTAYPVKMFEYMAAGLPVIASDFPLWREIVEGASCGLLVNPLDPEAIATAMQWILDNPEEAAAMGRRGRAAVEERYNWEAESEKLITLYRELIAQGRPME